ncbi:phage tail protein [Streptomyces sp. ME02-8801-2C]|uniref:phage tail protein n=1 Tax=Streptomyces sp. ME02-8801-2C TaxID=3028680 RepID=UPI0029B4DEB3|nr:phage tail protein [Streptomyces sp. ME02-8801-2C]MDX3452468.1 phage tail protein [Streptomyces sp. ME02-8801-2C]
MRVDAFTATADLIGRRVLVSWTFVPEPGESVAVPPPVALRRKLRDFSFPGVPSNGADPYLVHDSAAFPPAPVPGVLVVRDLPDRDWTEGAERVREQTVTVAELVTGAPREMVRRTVRTVFAADRRVLRHEVDLLDVGGPGTELDPGTTYYYRLETPGRPGEPLLATATPGSPHGHNRTLYELIPEVYRRHDTVTRPPDEGTGLLPEAAGKGGQLRRFVDVFGAGLDSVRSSAEGLRSLRDVTSVDARFLPLLADWIGWDLTADQDIARRRNEIATAPRLYAAVGTMPGLRSVVDHYTGWSTRVTEFVQHLSRTGNPPQYNVFAAVRRPDPAGGPEPVWAGADDAAPVLGFAPPNDRAVGTQAHAAELTGTLREPFALHPGMTLTVAVDGGLPATLTFGPGDFADLSAATAGEVAAVVDRLADGLRAEAVGGVLRLRSPLQGPDSRIVLEGSPAGLVSLDGAPRGRIATDLDPLGRLWVAHAGTIGPGTIQPRLTCKARLRGRWYDGQQVEDRPVAAQADPAVVALPDGRLWLSWVEHPDTPAARLRWRVGTSRPLTPARLRGETAAPFRLVPGTRMTLTGYGATEVFTVHPADYADPGAATAQEVVAAVNAQFDGVSAAAAADGSLALHTTATGPGVVLRADLAESTAARALGFGDRRMIGRGGWEPELDWQPAAEVDTVDPGRLADCTAVLDPQGAVRLFWSTHRQGTWQIARARWDDSLLVATAAGVGVLHGDGSWRSVTAADGLPSNDVRATAPDADGSTWYATAAGAAVRTGGTLTALTTASTGGGLVDNDVRAVMVARDGTVWFAHAQGASGRRPDGTWTTPSTPQDGRHLAVDTAGRVWLATGNGLVRLGPAGEHRVFGTADGLPAADVRHIAPAADGSIWATTGLGIARITPSGTVSPVDLPTALTGPDGGTTPPAEVRDIRAVAFAAAPVGVRPEPGQTGTAWIATGAGLAELRPGGTAVLHTTAEGLPGNDCHAVSVAPDGEVRVGTTTGLGRRTPAGVWRRVTSADGLVGDQVRGLHGPWSAPQWFVPAGLADREPHVVGDGTRLWLTWAERQPETSSGENWCVRLRHWTLTSGWSVPTQVTGPPAPPARATDREPALSRLPSGGLRVYFRSDRGGGRRLWSTDLDASGTAGPPTPRLPGTASDGHPAPFTLPDGSEWLLFRSDRNVALGRLGGGIPGPDDTRTSRRAPEEASLRRFAGSVTAIPADLDRNRGRARFGDLGDYTPQQPRGGPMSADEVYTPATIGLYVDRGPAGRPLARRDAERLRQLLERFLPVNLRAVIILRSTELEEIVFAPGNELTDSYQDDYPFAEVLPPLEEATAVALPGWQVFLAGDGGSVAVDLDNPVTLRRRLWWPPFT